jgi:hypothetical protein
VAQRPQAVADSLSDQNFRTQADAIDSAEGRLEALEAAPLLEGTQGTAQAEWPGASYFSNKLEVTHGLGSVPTTAQATIYDDESNVLGWAAVREKTETKLVIYAMYFQQPEAGKKAKVMWLALK